MVKKVSVSKRTSLPKSVMKAKGTFQPNEGFGKTHRAEKTETRYFPGPLRKLISSTGSKVTTRSASSFGNFISFRKKPQVLKFARKKVAKKLRKPFSLLGKSHSAEKTKSGQLPQKI